MVTVGHYIANSQVMWSFEILQIVLLGAILKSKSI